MLRFRVLGASFSILGASFSSFGSLRRFELHSIRYRILVIALDFCCINIGLVFIKDRPVSSFLGASFSSFGCFVLRSSFSRASFSKLPRTGKRGRTPRPIIVRLVHHNMKVQLLRKRRELKAQETNFDIREDLTHSTLSS